MTFEYLLTHGKYTAELTSPRNLVVRLLTIFCWATTLACFVLGPYLFNITGAYQILFPAIAEGSLSLTVVFLAKKRKYRTAIRLMFCLHSVAIWYYSVLLGPAANPFAFSVFLFLAACFWFDHRKTSFYVAQSAIAMMLFLIQLNYRWLIFTPLDFTAYQQEITALTANISFALLLLILVYSYFSVRSSYDLNLAMKTEKDQAELQARLEQVTQEEKQNLSATAHDLRGAANLLQIIVTSFFDQQDKGAVIAPEYFLALKTATNDIVDVVRDVLDIEIAEAEEVEKCVFNLRDHVETRSAYRLLREIIPQVTIDYHVPSDYIITDPKKIKCIINNLYINAIKYCQNSIKLRLYTEGKLLVIDILNDGKSIKNEHRKKIFERYFTAERRPDSSGLGLPLVKKMCELLSGSVHVKAAPPEGGTHFQVTLPITIPVSVDQSEPILKCLLPPGSPVYIVDDNKMEVVKIMNFLTALKYDVLTFDSVDEVISATIESPPDLIICDLNMPGKGARELLHEMNQKNLLDSTRVIVNTGDTIRRIQKELTSLGASGFLSKMATLSELIETLNKACAPTV